MAFLRENLMKFLIAIIALHTHFLLARTQSVQAYGPPPQNLTSNIQDYIALSFRQYEAQIVEYDVRITAYREANQKQLKPIDSQRSLIEQKINELENRLNPLELLGSHPKYCVQKYRYNLTTVSSVRNSISSCTSSATTTLNSYANSLESVRNTFRNYINNNIKSSLNSCERNHNASLVNYTICVTDVITIANVYASNNRNNFNTQLRNYECSADGRVQTAIECSFTTVFESISNIGQVTRLINDCLSNTACSQSCTHECPFSYVRYDDGYFDNSTISNPYFGLHNTTKCFTLYFTTQL